MSSFPYSSSLHTISYFNEFVFVLVFNFGIALNEDATRYILTEMSPFREPIYMFAKEATLVRWISNERLGLGRKAKEDCVQMQNKSEAVSS
jgi:hypothetical protein